MNILLVNDDGYNKEGLLILKEYLKEYGTVYMCAPRYPQSGKSAAFTYLSGLDVEKIDEYNYIVDGTPVDCTAFATNVLDIEFDLVVSGCNNGFNISYDCFYSGTIGACKEALVHGIPAIAFSTDVKHFDIVRKEFHNVMKYILRYKLINKEYILNVNFPSIEYKESKGIKLTKQYFRKDSFYYEIKDGKYFLDRYEDKYGGEEDYDVYCSRNGYISITPIHATSFNNETYNKLLNKIKEEI
ncbi:MAG: 5'/3'-nucleotidase SurE [Bacilli bacterium]|nr:5'/3'-nucleotidase SurE [Bacilli bacterium]